MSGYGPSCHPDSIPPSLCRTCSKGRDGLAEICGLTNRVGTLATGTDADFLVFDRDPLTLSAKPKMVFVDGVCVLNRESEKEG